MSAKTDFYAVLDADATLDTLVGDRIYPDAIPQGAAMPALVYAVREESQLGLGGAVLATRTVFSLGCWSDSRAGADAVAAAVRAVFAASGYPILSGAEGYDSEVGAYAATLETDDWR